MHSNKSCKANSHFCIWAAPCTSPYVFERSPVVIPRGLQGIIVRLKSLYSIWGIKQFFTAE